VEDAHLRRKGAELLGHLATNDAELLAHLATNGTELGAHLGADGSKFIPHLGADGSKFIPHLGADGSKFIPHLGADGSKFIPHLGTELRNLQRQVVKAAGKFFEPGHALLEAFYSGFKRLPRHHSSPSCRLFAIERRTETRKDWRMPCRL
jgi:hypothetical protein